MNRSASTGSRGGSVYLGKDILGSVRSATGEYGTLEGRYEYDAFGKPYKGELGDGMNLGYTGKPYDAVTGLYNYGYRDYKPEAARFTTVDPIRDGNNWFAYVNNDPVNFVDLWGLAPGDIFVSIDDAAIDFGNTYNDDSIKSNREYGASIYEKDGGYTYSIPSKGSSHSVTPSVEPTARTIADLHTHGADTDKFTTKDEFSREDIDLANKRNIPSYVALPSGILQKYDPQTGWIKDIAVLHTNQKDDPTIKFFQNIIDNFEHDKKFPDQKRGYLSNHSVSGDCTK
jgi:RHS repeat-associated protein